MQRMEQHRMDAVPSSASSFVESAAPPPRPRVPALRWIWVPFVLGAGLALVQLLLGEMTPFVLRLANPAPAYEFEFYQRIRVVEALFAPVVALLVALILALRGPAGAPRRSPPPRGVGG